MVKSLRVPPAVLQASAVGLVAGVIIALVIPAVIHAPSGILKVIKDGASQAPAWLTALGSIGSWFFVRWMRVRVIRFERIDYSELPDEVSAIISGDVPDLFIGCRLVVWLEIETRWANNRATDWRFSVSTKSGSRVTLTAMDKDWGAPRKWARGVIFFNLDQIRSMSLERDTVYNAFVYLEAPVLYSELVPDSWRVCFRDAYGKSKSLGAQG